ncbi:MAG: cupin domain-containing protein [Desulfobacterales bacterium]|nr:cupin domain-containing protein [Desulfobacterales bacterium]
MSANETIKKGEVIHVADSVGYAIGAIVSKTILKQEKGNITLFSFDAGQGLSEHTAPFDALVHVVEGEAQVSIGGEPRLVREGEIVIMPAGVPHALHAEKPFKMVLTMIRGA